MLTPFNFAMIIMARCKFGPVTRVQINWNTTWWSMTAWRRQGRSLAPTIAETSTVIRIMQPSQTFSNAIESMASITAKSNVITRIARTIRVYSSVMMPKTYQTMPSIVRSFTRMIWRALSSATKKLTFPMSEFAISFILLPRKKRLRRWRNRKFNSATKISILLLMSSFANQTISKSTTSIPASPGSVLQISHKIAFIVSVNISNPVHLNTNVWINMRFLDLENTARESTSKGLTLKPSTDALRIWVSLRQLNTAVESSKPKGITRRRKGGSTISVLRINAWRISVFPCLVSVYVLFLFRKT